VFESFRLVSTEQNYKAHIEMRCFTNLYINLLVPPFVTSEYYPKVLEGHHLLQCTAAYEIGFLET